MKPAAIVATLLLHTMIIGGIFYLGNGQPATRAGNTPMEVLVIKGMSSPTLTVSPKPNWRTSRVSVLDAPSSPHSLDLTTGQGASSEQQPSSGVTGKTTASIPAGYAASNRKPAYPMLSRRQGEQGTVLLRVLVNTDGTAGEIRIHQSSGYPLLDESALTAVRKWRFHPASINNYPIAEWYQVAIPFKLHN